MLRATALARARPSRLSLAPSLRHSSTTSASTAAAASPAQADEKAYFVHRTAGQQLPVYQESRSHGTQHLTRVQKVDGRVEDLKSELQQALGLPEHKIKINPTNRHIVIKGLVKKQVAAYLEQQRF